MTKTTCVLLSVVALAAAAPQSASASGYFWWQLHPTTADSTERGVEYKYYVDQPELTFSFVVRYEGTARPVVLDTDCLARLALSVRRDGKPFSVNQDWAATLRRAGEGASSDIPTGSDVVLDPDDRIEASLVLKRGDGGPFEAGDYDVTVSVDACVGATRFESGEPWEGRRVSSATIHLLIKTATSTAERKRQLMIDASVARSRGELPTALAHYQKMTELDPGDWNARAGAGMILVQLGRFSEGVALLERVLPSVSSERSLVPRTAAYAYVALGNEARARAILLRVMTPRGVDAEIGRLRAEVSKGKGR